MKHKNIPLLFISSGTVVLIAFGIFLATATPASAQCGSQASSCKNCHEVQGQDPVNSDGTEWHQSHAFGDFCYICHGGNQQATDKDAAHQGMEDPLSDKLLSGEFKNGDSILVAVDPDGDLILESEEKPEKEEAPAV